MQGILKEKKGRRGHFGGFFFARSAEGIRKTEPFGAFPSVQREALMKGEAFQFYLPYAGGR